MHVTDTEKKKLGFYLYKKLQANINSNPSKIKGGSKKHAGLCHAPRRGAVHAQAMYNKF
jgi:hypothetical protein